MQKKAKKESWLDGGYEKNGLKQHTRDKCFARHDKTCSRDRLQFLKSKRLQLILSLSIPGKL